MKQVRVCPGTHVLLIVGLDTKLHCIPMTAVHIDTNSVRVPFALVRLVSTQVLF